MKKTVIAWLFIIVFAVYAEAAEIQVPLGTRIEGITMNGIFAAENVTSPSFPIKVSKNPLAAGGSEIQLKDCIILGDVMADMTVKRALFTANRIVCPNSKELNGVLIKGYAIDSEDNKVGIKGTVEISKDLSPAPAKTPAADAKDKAAAKAPADASKDTAPAVAAPRFMEIAPDKKVILFIVEGVSIAVK